MNDGEALFSFGPPAAPRLLWQARFGQGGGAHPAIADGTVCAWDGAGNLLLVDAGTGSVRTRTLPDQTVETVHGVDGHILVLGTAPRCPGSRCLSAFHLDRCEILWSRDLSVEHTVTHGGRIYACSSEDHRIHALGAADGGTLWTHHLRPFTLRPSLVPAGETLYVGAEGTAGFGTEGYALALDAETGDIGWICATRGTVLRPPVLGDDRIYVSAAPRQLYCLAHEPASRLGEILWQQDLESSVERGALAGGVLYAGTYDGPILAIDGATGRLLWRFQGESATADEGPPCIVGSWIFAGSDDGYVYGLDRQTGALRWKWFCGEGAVEDESVEPDQRREPWEPLLWTAGERLYAADRHGFLSCFQIPREEA